MSRPPRTCDSHTCPRTPQPTRSSRSFSERILVHLGTILALSGAIAAAVAAVFSIIPATAIKVDPTMRSPVGPLRQARLVGLDHSGGDLRRAPRLTRRARRLGFGQPWMDGTGGLARKATYSVVVASSRRLDATAIATRSFGALTMPAG